MRSGFRILSGYGLPSYIVFRKALTSAIAIDSAISLCMAAVYRY